MKEKLSELRTLMDTTKGVKNTKMTTQIGTRTMFESAKQKAFNFTKQDDRVVSSKETDRRTTTSTPFNELRNNLNTSQVTDQQPAVSSHNPDTLSMLDSLKLSKYSDLLGDTAISGINDELLTDLELPLGHKLKILKKVKELRSKRKVEEEEKQPIYDQNNMLPTREPTQIEYEELPYEVSRNYICIFLTNFNYLGAKIKPEGQI